MKKALIITTVSGFVPQFEMNNVRILQSIGYEVHYATNYHMPVYTDNNHRLKGSGIIPHQIDFVRSPFQLVKNIIAYKQLSRLMRKIPFDLIHCHTPMGGVLGRLAAKRTETKPVLYTAHGFHFYKGAPIWNWIFFYPVERWLARYTDILITINKEDEKRAKKFHLRKQGKVFYIPGVGIPIKEIQKKAKEAKNIKESLGIPINKKVIVSVGELSKRKNHQIVIRALYKRNKNDYIYLICGNGNQKNALKKLIYRLNMNDNVRLLGYQSNVYEILSCADLFLFPSLQEGLPVALMEAIVIGIPVICSNIRGNIDLIVNSANGHCVKKNIVFNYVNAINQILKEDKTVLYDRNIKASKINQLFQYDNSQIKNKMEKIYCLIK